MTYKIRLSNKNQLRGKKIILGLSIGQQYHQGEKLKTVLSFAKEYDAALLLGDSLHRYNHGYTYEQAYSLGCQFIDEYSDDLVGLTLLRWDEVANEQNEIYLNYLNYIYQHLSPGIALYESMVATAKNLRSFQVSLKNSIHYQAEENAAIWSLPYDYFLYPSQISAGMENAAQFLQTAFPQACLPQYTPYRVCRKK